MLEDSGEVGTVKPARATGAQIFVAFAIGFALVTFLAGTLPIVGGIVSVLFIASAAIMLKARQSGGPSLGCLGVMAVVGVIGLAFAVSPKIATTVENNQRAEKIRADATPGQAPESASQSGGGSSDALSDRAAAKLVVDYRACPEKQSDRLATMLAAIFTAANDDPIGSGVVGRDGDTVRVAVSYSERGQTKFTTFDLSASSKSVTGEDSVARDALGALQAECH